MDDWGWQQLRPWIERRLQLPVGPLLCVASGSTAGRPWAPSAARAQLRRLAAQAGVRRRFARISCGTPSAVEMARDGVSLNVIQRQLGHANLGITSVYLEGIDNAEIIDAVHARRPPMLPRPLARACSYRCHAERRARRGARAKEQPHHCADDVRKRSG